MDFKITREKRRKEVKNYLALSLGFLLLFFLAGFIIAPNLIENLLSPSLTYIGWQHNLTEGNTTHGVRNLAPVLFMDFNSPNESTYVRDNSIYNNFGNLSGATWNVTGGYDGSGAYMFDGVNDYIDLSGGNNLDASSITVSAWIKVPNNNPGDWVRIVGRGNTSFLTSYTLLFNNADKAYFAVVRTDGTEVNCAGTTVAANVWYHLVGTYSNGVMRCYVNGLLNSSGSGSALGIKTLSNPKTVIGAEPNIASFFNGSIDQVQILPYALTADQVLCLYNGTGNCGGKNNSDYLGKYASRGEFTSLVFYNSTSTYWNTTTSQADTFSPATGIVNNKNEINLSHPNLVSYWALDGNTLDATGRNNGTPVNGVNNATGLSSNAMRFDGINDYIQTTTAVASTLGGGTTFSAWVKLNNDTATQVVIGDYNSNAGNLKGFELRLASRDLSFLHLFNGGEYYVGRQTTGDEILVGKWYHLVGIWNGTFGGSSGFKVYINGIQTDDANNEGNPSSFSSYVQSSTPILIGQTVWSGGPAAKVNGTIDEVLIYNTSLTAAQVQQLYKAGLSQHAETNITLQTRVANSYNLSDSKLVGMWGLNGNALDEKGINNGTITNALSNSSYGVIGGSYFFDSSGDYINLGANFDQYVDDEDPLSVCAWANSLNTNLEQPIVGATGSYPSGFFEFRLYQGRMSIYANSQTFTPQGNTRISNHTWNHLCYIWNVSNNLKYYLNGQLDNSTSFTFYPRANIGNLLIGAYYYSGAYYSFYGNIDDVRIYNRLLGEEEIQNLYNLGSYHLNWSSWSNEGTCYDNQTEILTEEGWKLFSELSREEKVATLNPDLGEIEYHLPSAYQVYESPGFMYRIKTSEGDLVVSSEHKLYSGKFSKDKNWFKTIFLVIGILVLVFSLAGLIKLKFLRKNEF